MIAKAPIATVWEMRFHADFIPEFQRMDVDVKKELLAIAKAVGWIGPAAGRPAVGSLKNPTHPNMKEMRFKCKGGTEIWRAAFAFDQNSVGIILCAGDKQGVKSSAFYKSLLAKANIRFSTHQKTLQTANKRLTTKPASQK